MKPEKLPEELKSKKNESAPKRVCSRCGINRLSIYNTDKLCHACKIIIGEESDTFLNDRMPGAGGGTHSGSSKED